MMVTRFITALVVSAAAVFAQVTVNTPLGVLACTNQVVTWSGGTAPYILSIQPGGDVSAAALETFTGITGMSYTWHVIEQANTQVFLRIHDAAGNTNESGTFTIQSAGGTVCSGTTGGTSAVAGTDTTAAAATTPAAGATTTPAAGGATTTPAAGGNTTPAASSTGSASSSHSTTTTTHNGASSLQVAGGLVGLVGAVAVALA